MPMIKVNCAACGAPISIPPASDLEFITCSSCGTSLQVEHGEGYISLKIAEKIAQSIEASGHAR
jgi:transcription elongation factor Elf1